MRFWKMLFVVLALFTSTPCWSQDAGVPSPIPTISLSGAIAPETAERFEFILDKISEFPTPVKRINVVIDSKGGSYDASMRIARMMEDAPYLFVCRVDGTAASGAFLILQSCDVRIATTRSMLMVHEAAVETSISTHNVKQLMEVLRVMNDTIVAQCYKLKVPQSEIAQKLAAGDWWMNPKDALQVGAVDKVVSPTQPW